MQHSPDYGVVIVFVFQVLKHSHANIAGFSQNAPQSTKPPTQTAKCLIFPSKWSTATKTTQDFIRSNCSSKWHPRPSYHQSFTHLGTVKSTSIFIVHMYRNINTHTHTFFHQTTVQHMQREHQSEQTHTRKTKEDWKSQKYIQVKKKGREEIIRQHPVAQQGLARPHRRPNHRQLRAFKDIEKRQLPLLKQTKNVKINKQGAHMWSICLFPVWSTTNHPLRCCYIEMPHIGQQVHTVSFWTAVFWKGTLCQIFLNTENCVQCI